MTETSEHELGYRFCSRRYPHAPGYSRLDIVLRATPTGHHFDPEKVRLAVVSADEDIELLSVCHPWLGASRHRALVGYVRLHDRKGKVVKAFTFGGDLQITSEEERTTCVLTSPAPIIELTPASLSPRPTMPMMLVEEVESLIAQRRAAWNQERDPAMFDKRMMATDPFTLYLACLEALGEKFTRFAHQVEDDLTRQFTQFVHAEIQALCERGAWLLHVPPLAKLL